MLNKPVEEIVMEGDHVVGVKSEGEVRKTSLGSESVSTPIGLQVALCSQ